MDSIFTTYYCNSAASDCSVPGDESGVTAKPGGPKPGGGFGSPQRTAGLACKTLTSALRETLRQ